MTSNDWKKKAARTMYVIVPLLFLFLIFGHEFLWRYESSLHITRMVKIRDAKMQEKDLFIEEENASPIDTVRRELKNSGSITKAIIWLEGAHDTIHTTIAGKYFSDFRPVHLSSDSSTQIMLIPNSFQELPTGWTSLLYLNNDSLAIKEFSGYFIGDIDNDGDEEVNIPDKGWVKLDTKTGDWIPALVKI